MGTSSSKQQAVRREQLHRPPLSTGQELIGHNASVSVIGQLAPGTRPRALPQLRAGDVCADG